MGRPSTYSPEIATRICEQIMQGLGLREICSADDMPVCATVFNWLGKHKEFLEQYTHAREIQAELLADEIVAIADDGTNDYMMRKFGETEVEVVDHENINRSRLRVDARKWVAAKLLPKKYGEKVQNEITGKDGSALVFTVAKIGDVTKQ